MSQILAILEDVAEIAPEDVNENSVLMDDLDLSSMEILTIVADLEETFGLRTRKRNCATLSPSVTWPITGSQCRVSRWKQHSVRRSMSFRASCTISAGKKCAPGISSP